jgi:2-hydroxychromene-2-carboxylate isomerase
MAVIDVVHFTDPGCPWAYSAWPHLTALQWRYGDQLRWRHVMIGLAETPERYVRDGYTPERGALGYRSFRTRGMPFATAPRERVMATSRACRAIVAVGERHPERQVATFRALQFGWFTTALLMDTDEAIATALARVDGIDVDAIVAAIDDDATVAAYEAQRAEAREAAGSVTEAQGKSAATDGPVRYTAPSLLLTTADGRSLEAGGFQSLQVYDVCVMNLDRTLDRRGRPDDVAELLAAFPDGLTTREVAQVLAADNDAPHDASAEDDLIRAAAAGRVRRETLGHDALWHAG